MLKRLVSTANRQARGKIFYSRGIANTSTRWSATNFVMPALSPTMTEGNISSWKVKEGDSFAPGDVLLEIETDKATMDVEAQEEGKLAKITQSDGSKGVKVGQRIAVLAEADDDLASLEIPPEDKSAPATKKSDSKQDPDAKTQSKTDSAPNTEHPPASRQSESSPAEAQTGNPASRSYPLYPSVQVLLHRHGISVEDARGIPASGPNGRLLKGDVLVHVGQIEKDYASKQARLIKTREHLDLSNVKIAPPKIPVKQETKLEPAPEPRKDVEMSMPISLGAVYELQRRMQDTLGVNVSVATIIARASEMANEQLPSARRTPTADELFDAVLGLGQVRKTQHGTFTPRIATLAHTRPALPLRRNMDIIDALVGSTKQTSLSHAQRRLTPDVIPIENSNTFSVTARSGEEQQAQIYLERVKSILELEPGRCIF